MPGIIERVDGLHGRFVCGLEYAVDGWLTGLAARLAFASVLLVYFLKSGMTKIGAGPLGFLSPSTGAYAQILPKIAEAASYDISQIPFFPYGLAVLVGTWLEFILPVLIVLGLFTRAASIGMIIFIFTLSYVDITGHNADQTVIGAPFDGDPSALISDQRLLWCFLLLVLVLRGAGAVSLDALFRRIYGSA